MNSERMAVDIVRFLREASHADNFDDQTDLLESGLLNSLLLMDLLTFVERQYSVRLPASDLTPANLSTVGAIVELIQRST